MENTKKPCCVKQLIVSTVAAFVFMMAYDWLVHSKLLMQMYTDTAALWRPQDQMQAMMPWCLGMHVAFALLAAIAYKCLRCKTAACPIPADGKAPCPVGQSLAFGLWFGLLTGIGMASMYIFLPIPAALALAWFAANLVKGVLLGLVLKFTYCSKKDQQS